MEVGVRLTVVATQGEADVICSLLRAHGIECGERATDVSAEQGGGWGGQREVLVARADLVSAQELLNSSNRS
jgi:type III secretory pathway lipoprotein EscJ